jgi:hypothetical protein
MAYVWRGGEKKMMTNKHRIGDHRARQIYTIKIETVSADDYDAIQEFINNHEFEAHFKRTTKSSMTARILETNNPCSDAHCIKEFEICEEDERAKLLQL